MLHAVGVKRHAVTLALLGLLTACTISPSSSSGHLEIRPALHLYLMCPGKLAPPASPRSIAYVRAQNEYANGRRICAQAGPSVLPLRVVASAQLRQADSFADGEPTHDWEVVINLTPAGASAVQDLWAACTAVDRECPGTFRAGRYLRGSQGSYLIVVNGIFYGLPMSPGNLLPAALRTSPGSVDIGDLTKPEGERIMASVTAD